MEQAMERLSSGKRINSAMDDAAGLSISHSLDGKITSLNQAVRNANDGIAMINLAEGAMEEISSMLTRMKELATQAANGTYQEDDQNSMAAEFDQLVAEIDRVASSTDFNGVDVLNSTTTAKIQVGDAAGDVIDIDFQQVGKANLGGGTPTSSDTNAYTSASSYTEMELQDDGSYAVKQTDGSTDDDPILSVTAASGTAQMNISSLDYTSFGNAVDSTKTQLLKVEVNGHTYEAALVDGESTEVQLSATLTALASKIEEGEEDLFTVGLSSTHDTGKLNNTLTITAAADNTQYAIGQVELVNRSDVPGSSPKLEDADISFDGDVSSALTSINNAIAQVDAYRSDLGAIANRLDHTTSNLMSRIEHQSAARSRIEDADYAVESANLAKAQVLQQAGTAMLSQANASTQNVLSLLK
jgi:flagellin